MPGAAPPRPIPSLKLQWAGSGWLVGHAGWLRQDELIRYKRGLDAIAALPNARSRKAHKSQIGYARKETLLRRNPGQPLAILVVLDVEKARTFFREPAVAYGALQGPAFLVYRPGLLVKDCKMTKAASALAASKRQPRPSSRGPIEHLHRKVMRLPTFFGQCVPILQTLMGRIPMVKRPLAFLRPVARFAGFHRGITFDFYRLSVQHAIV